MNLDEIRKEIDKIDQALAPLIEERVRLVTKIARFKEGTRIPVFDEDRERKVLKNVEKLVASKQLREVVSESFQALMDVSKKYQLKEIER
ncbi:MAG: chorismate mutase [Lactobacillales bacterium]|jgi:monofunctional chorismate mutase|nr:chorismate mutase [Lactobacillales bacterium]